MYRKTVGLMKVEATVHGKPKILFVTPVLGHPPKGGPELRIENSIKALARISAITLYCRTSHAKMGGSEAFNYLKRFVDTIHFAPFCRQNSSPLIAHIRNFFLGTFLGRSSSCTESVSDFQDVIETAHEVGADVIWLGYGNISYPLLRYIKAHSNIPVVVDTDSVWSRFVLRGAPYAMDDIERQRIENEGEEKREEERWGTRLAEVTTSVSDVDAEYYRGLTDDPGSVHIFSNVIDLNTYKSVPPPREFTTPCIYLAGTFWSGSPMEDSARWVLEHVLPILKREVPEIHVYIAGRGSAQVLADIHDSAVTIAGELSSVLPYLTNATVAVVPLRFESGTRFKILEAGACGIPVVSTTLGAEGIPTTNGRDILIADTPQDFSNAIIRVIRDRQLAENLGLNLKELVTRSFSIDVLASEGQAILDHLITREQRLRL